MLFSDRQSSIQFIKNPNIIRDVLSTRKIKLEKVSTEDNPANMASKVVLFRKLKHCLNLAQIEAE